MHDRKVFDKSILGNFIEPLVISKEKYFWKDEWMSHRFAKIEISKAS